VPRLTALEAVGPHHAYLRGSQIYLALGPSLVRCTIFSSRSQLADSPGARIWSQLESGGMVRARVTVVVPEAAVL